MGVHFGFFFTIFGLSVCCALIVPNEIPTVLSLVYSNIPPLKIGQDTRFGIGFRLGPHADFQTLIELGPQTNTGKLAEVDSDAKRHAQWSPEVGDRLPVGSHPVKVAIPVGGKAEPKENKNVKKATQAEPKPKEAYMGKILFKTVPGIDYR